MSSILNTLKHAGVGFDVASSGELGQFYLLACWGKDMIMTGPAKPERLLRFALENKVGAFVIENTAQLMCLQELAKDLWIPTRRVTKIAATVEWRGKKCCRWVNKTTAFGMDQQTLLEILCQKCSYLY
ncbi:MAG: hypothetical protein MRQ11_00110 [Candidatus Midichloria mitochondrii]|nr:hypothetical protein [Candidatus Midichloria mitochondrii]MDJ1287816.1 hypothetical protein [Candidatus Midichloria mitochondrii]MDJ1298655.1 hypothetical protein [Candidatus Midichloria mitochondrii]MDJ1312584.1 hypothetical protein [Candidatus Midichloria mitochondrii]MDJ1583101.1 hypothetical protein [Candidatus Midichloria mitochondrii]